MKLENRNEMAKAGVSLITVLLFMLVATIAATATYKWLTSEGRSSAGRMQQSEAYQSAVAGIQSARSWMTYNANETGAVIKQYKDGKNAPIKLTDRLAAFVRPGQHYDVYLVGVNTENTTYKLKILSEGTSRNGLSKHSEIAILNVNGLYRVTRPDREIHVNTEFEYAYFGGSILYEGSNDASAMVVNGNWDKNPPKTTDGDFIVTGDARLSGNDIAVSGTTCIGGKMKGYQGSPVNGFTTKDFYIAGKAETFVGIISRNAYFDGDMEMGQSCGETNFQVLGNMTVDATINFNHCQTRVVKGNTCVLEHGQIKTDGNSVKLEGGAWMQADFPIWKDSDDNYDQSENFVVGTDENTKVYMKSGHPWSEYNGTLMAKSFKQAKNNPGNKGYRGCNGSTPNIGFSVCYQPDDGWDDEEHTPYPSKDSKENLYYIYYMPPGRKDIDFGAYTDNAMRVCDARMHCEGMKLQGYFVNFTTASKAGAFTTINHSFDADHSVNVPGKGSYRYLNHDGMHITGSPHCELNTAESKSWQPVCGVKPWFTVNGNFMPWVETKPEDLPCAESVKEHCFSIWEEAPGCDGAKFVVRDQLRIASDKFMEYANKPTCASNIAGLTADDFNGELEFKRLDTCYSTAATHDAGVDDPEDKYLYNEYLVIKLSSAALFKKTQSSATISGKFIFVLDVAGSDYQVKLPSTATSKDYALIYLPKGFHTTDNSQFLLEGNGLFNYFIFSDHDIYGMQGNNHTLDGTVYMKQATCAKLHHMWTSNLKYNKDLMNHLVLNGVVCPASVSAADCGGSGTPVDSTSSMSIEYVGGGVDDYYISVAPQLSVTLESQYKNKEEVSSSKPGDVKGSFIVLPRIVYLTTDAKGKLEDYYNVIPLNVVPAPGATALVTGISTSCDAEIPNSGKLTESGALPEGNYACEVTATVNNASGAESQKVPFWIVVAGGGGGLPAVSFVNASEEVGIGNETDVELSWEQTTGAGVTCAVTVVATDYEPEWEISTSPGVTQEGNQFRLSFNTSDETPKKILHVQNKSSSDGSVLFMIRDTEGCVPGAKPVEMLFNTNSITVQREGLAEYCDAENGGAGLAACQPGGEYHKMIQSDWPDCNVGSAIWVNANGTNCSTLQDNNKWSCGIAGDVSLVSAGDIVGCQVVIPSVNNMRSGPFEPNQEITLYAALKAIPQVFHVQFAVTGDLPDSQPIYISVDGEARSTCTYGDYKNSTRRSEKCDVKVYRGSTVKLSFNSDPTGVSEAPSEFSYWLCDEGVDCESNEPITIPYYEMTITGGNTVQAHFGENDKHCFFDEFKDENHYNRASVECGESNPLYCIDDCDESCGNISSGATKWRLLEGTMSNIDYSDGRISFKSKATRGKRESEKANIKAVVMSTAQAGKDGELKAQFQVPIEGLSNGDVAKATVKNSGFILRSNDLKTEFLMLNVFAASNGALYARLCVNGSSEAGKCKTMSFDRLRSIVATDIIMMSAKLSSVDGDNVLSVKVWPGSWARESDADEVSFALTDSELSGVSATANNEYVGYSLADQNFKLYGIGWKSETYNAQCWDVPPNISCSFKAAYTGGIVPLDSVVRPWVGFSAWYDKAYINCEPVYYYNGDDDNGCVTGISDTDYKECGSSYRFTSAGAHGYTNQQTHKEVKTAKASASGCLVAGPAAAWASQGVADHCGAFWVGEMNSCSNNITFEYTLSGDEGAYYGVSGSANVRDADLKVTLDNPAANEVEIYLYSINTDNQYTYGAGQPVYSLPYKTIGNGTITIPVNSLANVDGFDPERVGGVYVKTTGSANVNSVMSSCANVVAINSCSAAYDKTAGKWKISTVVNSYSHVAAIKVSETSNYITDGDAECGDSPECAWSGITGRVAKNVLPIEDANPYIGTGVRSYTFSVALTTDDGQTLTCNTEAVDISGTEGVCGSLTSTSIGQGQGLPVFSYGISNCPDTHCGYKILLSGGTEIVAATESGDGSWNTDGDAANKTTLLDPGDYYFTLQSTDNPAAFSSCNSETFKVTSLEESSSSTAVSSSGEESSSSIASSSSVAGGGATCVWENSSTSFWPGQGNVKLLVSNIQGLASDASFTLTCGNVSASSTCRTGGSCDNLQFSAPSTVGTYTCTLKNDAMTLCTPTLEVKAPLSCSVSSNTVPYGDKFKFTGKTATSSCHNCKLYRGNNEHQYVDNQNNIENYEITFNWSTSKTFTYECQCDNMAGSANKCTQTVASRVDPPTFDCETGLKATIDESNNVTIGLQNVIGCHEGSPWCHYSITGTGISEKTGTGVSNGSVNLGAFTDNGTDGSTKNYSVTLENSAGVSETQTCSVEFTAGSSGGGDVEREIVNNQYPQDTTVASGTCFALTGTWSNSGYSPTPSIQCNAVSPYRQIRITYGDNTWDAWDNKKQSLGVQLYYTTTKVTFIEGVCAYSMDGGSQIRCKFEN